jgi:hypothetical protein
MTATVSPSRAEPAAAAPPGADGDPSGGPALAGDAEAGPDGRSWPFGLLVVAAVAAGFVLRVAIGLTDDAPSTDETAYLRSGLSLVDGDGFVRNGGPELHFPPFVPFLLGLAGKVFDNPHTGTVVLTCLASTLIVVPLALLGRKVAGTVGGLTTAWVVALGPVLSTTLVNRGAGSEGVYALLLVTALWLVVAAAGRIGWGRLARVGGAGLMVGLAYLTRPEGLFFAAPLGVAVLVLAVRPVRASGAPGSVGSPGSPGSSAWRDRARAAVPAAAAFGLPLLLCVAPYVTYLHDNTGSWQLSAKTQDVSLRAWDAVARGDRHDRDQELYRLDATGLDFDDDRTSLPTLAREDPRGYAGIVGANVRTLAEDILNPQQVLAWLLLPLPLWGLAVHGAWRHRRSGAVRLLLAIGALPVATALVFFVQPRYLIVGAALATVLVGAGVAALAPRWRGPVFGGAVALLVLSSVQGFEGGGGWWHPTDQTDHQAAGEWLAANTAGDARIMARSYVVEYYAERPTIAIPYGDYDQVLRFARHYGAQYLVLDENTSGRLRPQLALLQLFDVLPGLRLVHEARAEGGVTRIFALDPAPSTDVPMGPRLGFVGDGA